MDDLLLTTIRRVEKLSEGMLCDTQHCSHNNNCKRSIIHYAPSTTKLLKHGVMVRAKHLTECCEHFIAYPDFLKDSPKP